MSQPASASRSGPILCFRAPLETRASMPALADLAKKKARDAAIFEQYPPAYWRALISNSSIDAYITRMATSSLQNYAADAERGVPFQPSHDIYASSLGASLTGEYKGRGGDGVEKVYADFYGIQGIDPAADMFFAKAQAGIATDVSIGFGDGTMTCSICNAEAYRFFGFTFAECEHVPGLEYPTGKNGKTEMAYLWVNDAHLYEVSTVYEGATPGAEIQTMKAQALADEGRLRDGDLKRLEQKGVRLRAPARLWVAAPPNSIPGTPVDGYLREPVSISGRLDIDQRVLAAPRKEGSMDPLTELRALLVEHGIEGEAEPLAAIRSALDERRAQHLEMARLRANAEASAELLAARTREIEDLSGEIARLRPEADAGRQYRTDVIAEALASGVRAYGEAFAREKYAGMFERMAIDEIRILQADWERTAKQRFPGGRQTVQGDEPDAPKPARRAIPVLASRS